MPGLVQILQAGEAGPASAPSSYMASVRVEIAFNAGQRTPASLYTWTDVSDYVELADGITVSWGRQDERSQADANQLSLTLDNSDGRFTFGKTTGPYGSGVKLDRPIRVIIDPVDGTEVEYFRGYVNEWPTEWNGTDAYASARITASSRLSRLGMRAQLRSIIEENILAASPVAYYTLGEPSGSAQANDSSGNGRDPLTLTGGPVLLVVFGNATGPGTDSLTAAEFAGGQYLRCDSAAGITSGAWSMSCFFSTSTTARQPLAVVTSGSQASGLSINTSGQLHGEAASASDFGGVTSGTTVSDGQTHHAALTFSASGTVTVYLDGVSLGTDTCAGGPAAGGLEVGGAMKFPQGGLYFSDLRLTGAVAHAAIFDTELTAAQVSAISSSGSTGFAGETTSARLARYAALAGIPAAEVSAETGQTTMVHVDTSDKQVVDLMRICETTEQGVLHDGRNGLLKMHNRAHRYTIASAYTLNMAEQEVEADYAPKVDRTGILNDIKVSNMAGTVTATKFDADSIENYGYVHTDIETASEDDDQPRALASWLLYKYKDPKERVPSLSIDVLAQVGKTPNSATVLATDVGDKIAVSNRPTQAATSSVDYFVEGGTLSIGPESMRLTLNLSPSSPEDQVLVIGDPVRGAIGTYPIGF